MPGSLAIRLVPELVLSFILNLNLIDRETRECGLKALELSPASEQLAENRNRVADRKEEGQTEHTHTGVRPLSSGE
ncbi:hypothetical protein SRHO_G00287000 [Serrasalmus rhombeus]